MNTRSRSVALFATFTFFSVSSIYAQLADTLRFNKQWKETTVKEEYYYFRTIQANSNGTFQVKDHYPNGKPQMIGSFATLKPEIRDGEFAYYNEAGQLTQKIIFFKNVPGETFVYNEKGLVTLHKFEAAYIKTLTRQEKKDRHGIIEVDEEPKYADGQQALSSFIRRHLNYPHEALKTIYKVWFSYRSL